MISRRPFSCEILYRKVICLKRDINDFLELISDTEIIKPDDRLSTFLKPDQDNELSESELDMVSAAANYSSKARVLNK